MLRNYLTLLTAVFGTLAASLRQMRSERGSVTLEQIAITAGLVALALGVIAAIGVAVSKYTSKI